MWGWCGGQFLFVRRTCTCRLRVLKECGIYFLDKGSCVRLLSAIEGSSGPCETASDVGGLPGRRSIVKKKFGMFGLVLYREQRHLRIFRICLQHQEHQQLPRYFCSPVLPFPSFIARPPGKTRFIRFAACFSPCVLEPHMPWPWDVFCCSTARKISPAAGGGKPDFVASQWGGKVLDVFDVKEVFRRVPSLSYPALCQFSNGDSCSTEGKFFFRPQFCTERRK